MPPPDPRLASLAAVLRDRLRLERSLGVCTLRHVAGGPMPAPTGPDAWHPGGAAAPAAQTPPTAKKPPEADVLPEAPSAEAGARRATLQALGEEARGCTRCRLCEGRSHVVFGEGDPAADLVFVGEGPGREEDEQGRPFVGRAGKLLTAMIENGLKRPRQTVYITNVVKCRPPDNRDPRYEEMEACRGYLEAQLAAIRPRVVVTLGRVAGCALTGQDLTMGRMRGRWFDVAGIPLLPTYHPSYLLRQRDAEGGKTKADRAVWEDLQAVQRRLERPPEA